jgi:hypothetical protein
VPFIFLQIAIVLGHCPEVYADIGHGNARKSTLPRTVMAVFTIHRHICVGM